MKNSKLILGLTGLLCLSTLAFGNPPVEEGKAIFTSRCAACHNVNKTLTGPALAGIEQRRSIEWLTKFITSSQSLVKSGDKEALAVFEKFNRIPMPDHTDLTTDHVKSIVEYIKSEARPDEASAAPFAKPTRLQTIYKPLSIKNDYGIFIAYLVAVGMLIATLVFVVHLNTFRNQKAAAGDRHK